MRVWLVTVGEPMPEPGADHRLLRTGILSQELARRGHDVTWWASTFDHFSKKEVASVTTRREWSGGRIVQLHVPVHYRSNISLRRIVHNVLTAREFRSQAARET